MEYLLPLFVIGVEFGSGNDIGGESSHVFSDLEFGLAVGDGAFQ